MKKKIALLAVGAAMAVAPSSAIASGAADAPGLKIQQACGASFGELVSGAKSTGTAAHRSYPGGAKAFSADPVLAVHGCATN